MSHCESRSKAALLTGISSQDGSYLTELLLGKGYTVHGIVRRSSSIARSRLSHLYADSTVYEKRLFRPATRTSANWTSP